MKIDDELGTRMSEAYIEVDKTQLFYNTLLMSVVMLTSRGKRRKYLEETSQFKLLF